jgi:uncharacterized protein (DUF58 family)
MRPALATGLLGLVLLAAAMLFDAEPLWVAGVALTAIAAGSETWVTLASRGVVVRRTLGATRVVEGEPLSVVLDVRTSGLALPTAQMRDPLLGLPAPLHPGRRGARVRIEASFSRRGVRRLAVASVRIADPLGLATREVHARPSPRDDEILVLPRLEPIASAAAGGDATRVARNARMLVGAEVELDGIRPLRDGTPASRIVWQAVARGADPQERYLRADGESQPLVVLDPRGAATDEDLDAAVRAAASLVHELASAGGCSVLLPGDRRPTEIGSALRNWPQIHARLAMIGPAGVVSLVSVAQRRGPIVFVSARMRLALPPALGSAQGAIRVLVVPGALADRPASFAVAGCNGYALGHRRSRALQRAPVRGTA